MKNRRLLLLCVWLCIGSISLANNLQSKKSDSQRERICLNTGWRFQKNDPEGVTERLDYARLKPYLLPWANDFIKTGKNMIVLLEIREARTRTQKPTLMIVVGEN